VSRSVHITPPPPPSADASVASDAGGESCHDAVCDSDGGALPRSGDCAGQDQQCGPYFEAAFTGDYGDVAALLEHGAAALRLGIAVTVTSSWRAQPLHPSAENEASSRVAPRHPWPAVATFDEASAAFVVHPTDTSSSQPLVFDVAPNALTVVVGPWDGAVADDRHMVSFVERRKGASTTVSVATATFASADALEAFVFGVRAADACRDVHVCQVLTRRAATGAVSAVADFCKHYDDDDAADGVGACRRWCASVGRDDVTVFSLARLWPRTAAAVPDLFAVEDSVQ
jgi:hypothetical protein